jgi:flavin-dependent dehydrogenase
MTIDWETEICVIGAGPAGSTVALSLARLGHQVLVLEQYAFPRAHVGESLSPAILPLLDTLGVRDRVERGPFLRPRQALIRWRDETAYVKWQPEEPGFQVDRGAFDLLLLEIALESGAKLLQPASALSPIQDSEAGWLVPFEYKGRVLCAKTRFLVDASGRRSGILSRRQRTSPPTVAIYGYWRNTGLKGAETRVESGNECWYWGAPLPDGSLNAAVFLDANKCRVARSASLEALYCSLLSESTLLSACLEGTLTTPLRACTASSSHAVTPIDNSLIKVGEASFSIDPLSSQGVQAAMQSALQASIVCHTIMTIPGNASTAIQFYRERQAETVKQHNEWTALFYLEELEFKRNKFWEERAYREKPSLNRSVRHNRDAPYPECRIAISDDVRIVKAAVIKGQTIGLSDAIDHVAFERPVAFLNDIAVVPLLKIVVPGQTFANTLEKWSRSISPRIAREILRWMWVRHIIIPLESTDKANWAAL